MSFIPFLLRKRFSVCNNSFQTFQIVHESTFRYTVNNISENSVKSGVSIQIFSSKYEFQVSGDWVIDIKLNSLGVRLGPVLDKTDSSLEFNTVGVVDVGPDSLDVIVVDVLNHIGLIAILVASGVVVVSLSLPYCQHSISHSYIFVGDVLGEPSHEVPRCILAVF